MKATRIYDLAAMVEANPPPAALTDPAPGCTDADIIECLKEIEADDDGLPVFAPTDERC